MASLEEAFQPAHEIEDPSLFAGRRREVQRAVRALKSKGASFLIYGHRGVGKSSFAKQIRLIAGGQSELLHLLKLSSEAPDDGFRHPVVYFACNDFIKNVEGLLNAILTDSDNIYGLGQFFDGMKTSERTQSATTKSGIAVGAINGTLEDTVNEKRVPLAESTDSTFRRVTLKVVEASDNWQLVLVIDELERLTDKTGLASLIKTIPHIKFVLVGVAENFAELVQDHESVDRQLSEGVIRLSSMTHDELKEIVFKGEALLEGRLKYGDEVASLIASRASGFPYFVHLLAREAGYTTQSEGRNQVYATDIEKAIQEIVRSQKAPRYEAMFQKSVKGSAQRELVLRTFAEEEGDEIYTRDVYRRCGDEGVTNSSQHVGTLVAEGALVKVREDCYRFADELFRVYVRLRDWKFKRP